jgi:hypothetical protein
VARPAADSAEYRREGCAIRMDLLVFCLSRALFAGADLPFRPAEAIFRGDNLPVEP